MKKIAIVGAGASGLAAAITAARCGAEVCLFEQRETAAKKLLVTGNGKCNFLNEDQWAGHFHSQNPALAEKILEELPYKELLDFFEGMGILPYSRKGYLYPMSGQAQSIHMALIETAKSLGVLFCCSTRVEKIERCRGHFIIHTDGKNSARANALILSTGTRAGTKIKENPGAALVQSFGHHIIPFTPALCALRSDGLICRYWHGVRTQAELTLLVDGKAAASEKGELMLTDYGISGIPAFQVSHLVAPALREKKNVLAHVDWLPGIDKDALMRFLDNLSVSFPFRKVSGLLYGILPVKLADSLIVEATKREEELKELGAHMMSWNHMSVSQKNAIIKNIKHFLLPVMGVNDFEHAQVCAGGVPLTEIEIPACRSKLDNELYLTGELLDVHGDCGGYNLQWAWTTGIIAGRGAAKT